MKKLYYLIALLLLSSQVLIAQSVPMGMKYQAVARDLSGQILAEQTIKLQVNLLAGDRNETMAYSEVHEVKTNSLGLFTLTIGEGRVNRGAFDAVPWSSEDIWMEIKIQDNASDRYITISNSKMLSVPYAFHAATAGDLVRQSERGGPGNGNGPGVPSQNWSLFGNSNSDPAIDKLGTTDDADLAIVTNNIERMRIYEDGDINMTNSLNIGKNLTVQENVFLNRTTGETVNYGPLTVERNSPTLLTGSLTVSHQSPTLLSGTLTVDLATDLNASLNVDGPTNLNSLLNVNNGSPTLLTGTLLVNDDATFNEKVLLDNPNHQSTSVTTGALVVAGGVGVGKNFNVGGASTFGGPVQFNSPVTISALDESTNTGNGALIVAGGVGIGKRINVGGAADFENTLHADGATTLGSTLGVTGATSLQNTLTVSQATQLNSTLGVTGITSLTNTMQSSATTNGALVVSGGAGIAKNLYIGGSTFMTGPLKVTADVGNVSGANSVTQPSNHIVNFYNTNTNGNGISIQVGATTPHNKNNFITFYNGSGATVGRIEGERGNDDLSRNQEYLDDEAFLITDVTFESVGEAIAIAEEIQAILAVACASTSTTVCAGLGACITGPIPSLIVSAAADLILQTANLVLQTANLAEAAANLVVFRNTHANLFGITFASGSEDYAEYLPKLNADEVFLPGDIVGVKNGFISKNTKDADKIMVISHKPVVLGGLPRDEDVSGYEMVAFMGQIPTRIAGTVKTGDFILPSGFNNGYGVAKSPEFMRPEDYKRVLGVAWEENTEMSLALVNTAIGLNTNDLTDLVIDQEEKINAQEDKILNLEAMLNKTQSILAELVPGYAEAAQIEVSQKSIEPSHNHDDHDHSLHELENVTAHVSDVELLQSGEEDIIYFELDRKYFDQAISLIKNQYAARGIDLNKIDYWKTLNSDPKMLDELYEDIKNKMTYTMHHHQQVNQEIIKE